MEVTKLLDKAYLHELKWDTDFFGVSCAKVVLNESLTEYEWSNLKNRFNGYKFISIENRNSQPVNAQLIGKDTKAFLADVNIQFTKSIDSCYEKPINIEIYHGLGRDERIIDIAKFEVSKFTEDTELAKLGGDKVYKEWVINAFGKKDKFFTLFRNKDGKIEGFLLHSYSDDECVIELIAVSSDEYRSGIGTSLFRATEYFANESGAKIIKVGTQVRNTKAINFYNKVGCRQVACHQVYHLWN